jgi:hypothetical protein
LIPGFAAITSGKASEIEQADQWTFLKFSVLVFDKRYNSCAWHKTLAEKGYIWVTRIQDNALYHVIEGRPVAQGSHVTSDQVIKYTGMKVQEEQSPPIRRGDYHDPGTGKHYVFITNQFNQAAQKTPTSINNAGKLNHSSSGSSRT